MAKASRIFHRRGRGIASMIGIQAGLEIGAPSVLDQRRDPPETFLLMKSSYMGDKSLSLFLQQAGVAGDALPAAFGVHPGIGEAADMLVGLPLVGTFGTVNADHYGGVGVHADLEVLTRQASEVELRVSDVGQELGFIAHLAVILGVHEGGADHGVESTGVAVHLSFVPQVLHYRSFDCCESSFVL